jgi:hypothetical protein
MAFPKHLLSQENKVNEKTCLDQEAEVVDTASECVDAEEGVEAPLAAPSADYHHAQDCDEYSEEEDPIGAETDPLEKEESEEIAVGEESTQSPEEEEAVSVENTGWNIEYSDLSAPMHPIVTYLLGGHSSENCRVERLLEKGLSRSQIYHALATCHAVSQTYIKKPMQRLSKTGCALADAWLAAYKIREREYGVRWRMRELAEKNSVCEAWAKHVENAIHEGFAQSYRSAFVHYLQTVLVGGFRKGKMYNDGHRALRYYEVNHSFFLNTFVRLACEEERQVFMQEFVSACMRCSEWLHVLDLFCCFAEHKGKTNGFTGRTRLVRVLSDEAVMFRNELYATAHKYFPDNDARRKFLWACREKKWTDEQMQFIANVREDYEQVRLEETLAQIA